MSPKELKSFFDVYPEAVVYKVGQRFFLSKDKNLAEDYARTKELEVETITKNSKSEKDPAAEAKAAAEAASKESKK